jgi:hypothetical protein
MSFKWTHGNAVEDGRETRGWLLGHFIDQAEGVRSSKDVEVKGASTPRATSVPSGPRTTSEQPSYCRYKAPSKSTSRKPASP